MSRCVNPEPNDARLLNAIANAKVSRESAANESCSHQNDDEMRSSLVRLLNRMVQKGLFQEQSTLTPPSNDDATHPNENIEDMQNFKEGKPAESYSTQSSTLVFAKGLYSTNIDDEDICCAMTTDYLQAQIKNRLLSIGRVSFLDLAEEFFVDVEDIKDATETLDDDSSAIHVVGMDLLNERHLDEIFRQLVKEISDVKAVQDIAKQWNLPLQFSIDILKRRVESVGLKMTENGDGTKQIVTHQYENKMFAALDNLMCSTKVPLKLSDIMMRVSIEPHEILAHIKTQLQHEAYAGSVHEESTSTVTTTNLSSMYVPNSYEQEQESEVTAFFDTNGYVTIRHGGGVGLSKKRFVECILKHNPRAITLEQCMIHPDIIVAPVQAVMEECIEVETFLDLSQYIPDQITVNDCVNLMRDHIFEEGDDLGCLICLVDTAFYFSQGFIKNISKNILEPLIESYAKTRAREVTGATDTINIDHSEGDEQHIRKKVSPGTKGLRRSKRKSSLEPEDMSYGILSVASLVDAIVKEYPDLAEFQLTQIIEEENISWDNDDIGINGPLYAFCYDVFGASHTLQQKCDKAVKAEIAKCIAMKKGMSIRGNRSASVKNIEYSFEKSFKSSCHFLLMLAKYPRSLEDDERTDIKNEAERRFLITAAADFTRRLTEFCIFKNEVQNGLFSFFRVECVDDEDDDSFFNEIDISSKRTFKRVFLSCLSDKDSNQYQGNPLHALRDTLPSGVGVPLARMWVYCGGENYSGGEMTHDDGSVTSRTGDMEKFLSHAEDYCLSICGLPFKILDKKSEKQKLFARKKELQAQLQEAKISCDIVELSLILIFQRIKNTLICNVTDNILEILSSEKVPLPVSKLLKGDYYKEDTIRQLALCKDFANFEES